MSKMNPERARELRDEKPKAAASVKLATRERTPRPRVQSFAKW